MLSIDLLSVVLLSVIMLNVVAPHSKASKNFSAVQARPGTN
jgi:hypothetical protein